MVPPCPNFTLDYAFSRKVVPVLKSKEGKELREKTFVVGMLVNNRSDLAPDVQQIITEYGSDIISRFGVPSSDKKNGLIILIMQEEAAVQGLTNQLQEFEDLQIKIVQFE
ncbi:MAG TPA: hypothetical protein DDW93_10685 [Firmicutes bacterium]|nr:hypothetical protein [Bacillota bacterium]HBK69137.1 hypothetical protein [Bacillota bacterium]HBT15802.1 hypothetical protein [Bacillota bacterium]